MNSITVAGPLGRDAETRYMPDGTPVASFSVADSQGKDKPTTWWNCQIFGKRAESLAQYLTKGQSVTVSGTVTEREWTDKQGEKRKSMEIRVNDVALQGGKREAQPIPAHPASAQARYQPAPRTSSGFDDMESDAPF